MNRGSKRVTVRLGDELIDLIKKAVGQLNANPLCQRTWTVSEFIVQATVEKLSHRHRSAKRQVRVTAEKIEDFKPREVVENELY